MTNKQIKDYRKASAEYLGLKIKSHGQRETVVIINYWYTCWTPDAGYNQMFMIIDKLLNNGHGYIFMGTQDDGYLAVIIIDPDKADAKPNKCIGANKQSQLTAFAKAFMEFNSKK